MASLYDDIEDHMDKGSWSNISSTVHSGMSGNPNSSLSGMSMMESHMAVRKLQHMSRRKPTGSSTGPTLAPVVDLKRSNNANLNTIAEGDLKFNLQTGQMERIHHSSASFLSTTSPFIMDPGLSLGIDDEYNPIYPNDYEELVRLRREKRRKEEDEIAISSSGGGGGSSGFSRRPPSLSGYSSDEDHRNGKSPPSPSYSRSPSTAEHRHQQQYRRDSFDQQHSSSSSSSHHRHHHHNNNDRDRNSSRNNDYRSSHDRGGDRDYNRDRDRDRDRDSHNNRKSYRGSRNESTSGSGGGGGGRVGAAIAPPPSLSEDSGPPSMTPSEVEEFSGKFGINNVAAKMMARMGYREGQGLGREGQGMSTALTVEKTSRRGGKIIHEKDTVAAAAAAVASSRQTIAQQMEQQQQQQQQFKPPLPTVALSNVVLLQNMVGPGEVDEDLEPETKEECGKYGPVLGCVIYEIPDAPEERAVRIFVEFLHPDSAFKAVCELNGRFFGGRTVLADFYDEEKFRSLELSSSPLSSA